MTTQRALPKVRTEDIVVQEVDQETLVYDKKSHQAHCLNPLASLVWRHCVAQESWDELAQSLQQTLNMPGDAQVIELALQELANANLLLENAPQTAEQQQCTRRDVVRRFGITAAAALILAPLVISQKAAAQGSIASPTSKTDPRSGGR